MLPSYEMFCAVTCPSCSLIIRSSRLPQYLHTAATQCDAQSKTIWPRRLRRVRRDSVDGHHVDGCPFRRLSARTPPPYACGTSLRSMSTNDRKSRHCCALFHKKRCDSPWHWHRKNQMGSWRPIVSSPPRERIVHHDLRAVETNPRDSQSSPSRIHCEHRPWPGLCNRRI